MAITSKILKRSLGVGILLGILMGIVPTYAMAIGAYTVPARVSYANPETGEIMDGGSDEALGNSMCESVMQDEALIEYDGETTYVSLGIGLMSNISNIDIRVQNASGEDQYESVELIETGSYEIDGDTCVQYRFVMTDPNLLISPSLFVDPMGREVQFFIRLDTSDLQAGTANYFSEMVPEMGGETISSEAVVEMPETTPEVEPEITLEITPEITPTEVAVAATETGTPKEVGPTETPSAEATPPKYTIAIIAVIVILGGIVGVKLFMKRKKVSEK